MSALIPVDELAETLGDVVVLDVQFTLVGEPGRDLYVAAHLPGARFVDLDADLAGPPGDRGRHPLPDPAVLEAALRRVGVGSTSRVVVYDQRTSLAAARAWWVLRWASVPDVRVLDGGLAAWVDAGLPVTTEVPDVTPSALVVVPGGMPVLIADDVPAVVRDGILLDSRAPERYAGEVEPLDPVAGHIPGAVNAPMARQLEPDGRLRPSEALREYFAGLGVEPGTLVGTSCGSGVTAAHTALALHEAGVEAAVYVGSWSEWVADPSRPVATGATP
ncbi:putative 3-mercaptopyruvate sulfurtransferase [Nostocoides japonicum T1-X7]|uniref:Putative 3-mercaptopyruvate sulfurtransferase n=1 Tax=Nostocoides japonicum T1-X7 TaxID=1194083 RepID=A0A077LXQ8_9MICO|nr:sulfurtransferase [Tetrasphaera japonica]CCH76705.1 putative 3-mercaptopyruvate sulfurtransferase [Tetrasphaera japonica T1-X7]